MLTQWVKHVKSEEEKKEFEKSVRASRWILDHLMNIVIEDEQALDRSETDPKCFEDPNWSHKQAFKNGYRASLNNIKKLIDLDHQK